MTEQLKAEAYVREQRPALMELTFGCEIWPTQHREDMFTTSLWNVVAVDDRSLILRPKGKNIDEDMQTVDIKYCKIIGHPIRLNDWLAVLGEKHIVLIDIVTGGSTTKASVGETYITFNLTDGQPSSESDYKAFNKIVSV